MDKNYISTGADEKTGMLMDAVAIMRDTAVRSPRPSLMNRRYNYKHTT